MLNYHHLQYFWSVAKEGHLTRAAKSLHVSPSALSTQIRQLEEQLGQELFAREGRSLVLTESGKIAFGYAEKIFSMGEELVATLESGRRRSHLLRIGAVATLSRNFQRSFLRPLLGRAGVRLQLGAGSFEELLGKLAAHDLDLVLSTRPAPTDEGKYRCQRVARQPVSIVSAKPLRGFRFPSDLRRRPMILPGAGSELRAEFDALCARHRIRPRVFAEVDDMATMRLLARDSEALVLVPSVVVRDELREGLIHELVSLRDVAESFYAITVDRRFQHPRLRELLDREEGQFLGADSPEEADESAI